MGQTIHVGIDLVAATIGVGFLAVPTMVEVQARAPVRRRATTLDALNIASALGILLSADLLLLAGKPGFATPALLGLTGIASLVASAALARRSARDKTGDAVGMIFRAIHRVALKDAAHVSSTEQPAVLAGSGVIWLNALHGAPEPTGVQQGTVDETGRLLKAGYECDCWLCPRKGALEAGGFYFTEKATSPVRVCCPSSDRTVQ